MFRKGSFLMRFRNTSNAKKLIPESDIVKHHIELSGFDNIDIMKMKTYLMLNIADISWTEHFRDRCDEKHIPFVQTWKVLKFGKCFEYKEVDGELYRLAIRVSIPHYYYEDCIFVIQPEINEDGTVNIKYITAYKNKKEDTHVTLNAKRYTVI